MPKITEEQKRRFFNLYKQGFRAWPISRETGITRSHVNRILHEFNSGDFSWLDSGFRQQWKAISEDEKERIIKELSGSKMTWGEAVVSIVNKVKCGLISIGTQDALERVYSEWYAGDRAGNNIDTSSYCLDKKLISDILRALFVTQWFDEKVELTDDIVNAFFECTGGSMRKIKALYIEATQKYIIGRKKKHITVDGNFFREVALQRWATVF